MVFTVPKTFEIVMSYKSSGPAGKETSNIYKILMAKPIKICI
jgi:hypothetical protein